MTNFGFECQPIVSADQLATFTSVLNVVHCASKCNQQAICRSFDYDTSTMMCRLFSDASVVSSNSTTSRAGSVQYTPDLYSSYGQMCTRDNCEISRYLTCNPFNTCQCPAGQRPNAQMCVGESWEVFHCDSTRTLLSIVLLCVVVDKFFYRWNSSGTTVAGITGSLGTGANQLHSPSAISVDSSGALYISARDGHRVQKWLPGASNGTTIAGQANGTSGPGLSFLNKPIGLTVDANGDVYVTDTLNHRVVRWTQGASSGTIVAGTGKKCERFVSVRNAHVSICVRWGLSLVIELLGLESNQSSFHSQVQVAPQVISYPILETWRSMQVQAHFTYQTMQIIVS